MSPLSPSALSTTSWPVQWQGQPLFSDANRGNIIGHHWSLVSTAQCHNDQLTTGIDHTK